MNRQIGLLYNGAWKIYKEEPLSLVNILITLILFDWFIRLWGKGKQGLGDHNAIPYSQLQTAQEILN